MLWDTTDKRKDYHWLVGRLEQFPEDFQTSDKMRLKCASSTNLLWLMNCNEGEHTDDGDPKDNEEGSAV